MIRAAERKTDLGRGHFTHYWSNATWDRLEDGGLAGEPFVHDAGTGFARAGVRPGDVLFAVTAFRGTPYLLAAMEVGTLAGREEAAALLGARPEDLYAAPEQVLARPGTGTPMVFDRLLGEAEVLALRFVGPGGEPEGEGRPPAAARGADGLLLDRQALRGVRRLTGAAGRSLGALAGRED